MSYGSELTGSVLTAAGSMVTNGSQSGTFGAAPISSVAGISLSTTDEATNLTDFSPTLNTMVSALTSILGSGAPLSGLGTTLTAIKDGSFTNTMISAFNSIPDDLGTNGGLYDAISGFSSKCNPLLTGVNGGYNVLNDAFTYAGEWSAETLGGTFSGIGTDIVGDPKKFGTIFNTAFAYVSTANQMINAATNSTAIDATFTNMDNVATGGFSGVNLNLSGLATDLGKIGHTINFAQVDNLGSPGQLLSNMASQGTLGPMYQKLASIEVDSRVAQALGAFNVVEEQTLAISELGVDLNSVAKQGASLPPYVQQEIYKSLQSLNTTEVSQVKSILKNSQDSVTSGADLLDPLKIFPNCYETFTAPLRTTSVGFRAIYTNSTGSVNGEFENLGNKLKNILPENLAIANGALARSFGQVKNIRQSNSEDLSNSLASLETLNGLNLLESQTGYVQESVRTYWLDLYGVDSDNDISLATGNGGQLKLSDVIGFAAGYNSAAPLTSTAQLLTEMNNLGELNDIVGTKGIYDTVQKFCNNDFGPVVGVIDPYEVDITSGYVGEGTYGGATEEAAYENAWVNGIIPGIKIILASFTTNTRGTQIIANNARWNEQLAREYLNQSRADNADLTAVRASDDVALTMALNLSTFGKETSEGGPAELIERIVNFDSLGGQSIIASMRESRNLQSLADANIQSDAGINTSGLSDPGSLATSSYTSQQAKDQLIKS